MKKSGSLLGILLLFAGGCFLLYEFGLFDQILGGLHFSPWDMLSAIVSAAFDLWPLLLVAAGLSIIFRNRVFISIIWLLFILAIGAYMMIGPGKLLNGFSWLPQFEFSNILGGDETKEGSVEPESFAYSKEIDSSAEIISGKADIVLGACSLLLQGTDAKAAIINSSIEDLNAEWNIDQGTLTMAVQEENIVSGLDNLSRKTHVYLGENITWSLVISTGASKTGMDLRALRIKELEIEAGAGTVSARFGDHLPEVSVLVKGGASDISLIIPEGSGIRVEKKEGLSSSNFAAAGLQQISEGMYESENYAAAPNKITVRLSTGISNIRISRE